MILPLERRAYRAPQNQIERCQHCYDDIEQRPDGMWCTAGAADLLCDHEAAPGVFHTPLPRIVEDRL